jgi:hypothetical protein
VHRLVASPPPKHLPPALPIKVKRINLLAQYRWLTFIQTTQDIWLRVAIKLVCYVS